MQKIDKKQIIHKAVKQSKLYDGSDSMLEIVSHDVMDKSSFIFEIASNENEVFSFLISIVDAAILRINEEKDRNKDLMDKNREVLNTISDPKTLAFDISDESEYLKRLMAALYEIERDDPGKKYASIFYERYIQRLKNEMIAKMHNISVNEVELRLLEIVKIINKEA